MKEIEIKGAKEHNLKNVDLKLPRDKMIVFTGVSGSGKSSLAFDTIYAEGQRRYMQSLSSYARQFLGQMEKPKVDFIEGLPPAISIDQKSTNKNPRSTVGTITEIYDYMRLLFARIGEVRCYNCGRKIKKQTVDQMVDTILKLEEGTKIYVLAKIVRGKKGEHVKILEQARNSGFSRVKIDGLVYDLSEEIKLEKNKKHNIDILVDRIVVKKEIRSRLADSIETALKLTDGVLDIEILDGEIITFSENFSCPYCGINVSEIEPRSFSFNSPFGACEKCNGLGFSMEFSEDLIVPDKDLSINEGAIKVSGFSKGETNTYIYTVLKEVSNEVGFSLDTPYKDLSKEAKDILLNGYGNKVHINYTGKRGEHSLDVQFEGIFEILKRRYKEAYSDSVKTSYEQYMDIHECSSCNGKRLKKEILSVFVGDKNIDDLCKMSIKKLYTFIQELNLNDEQSLIAMEVLKEIKLRLGFMINVGLDYLSLSRMASTLSGGESQRIRLATQIGSGLVGVVYILDEPSIGLHQRDNDRLISALKSLRDLGNTLIVVEHDEDTMKEADYIVDIGPLAGSGGGKIVATGSIEEIMNCKESLTGKYLSKEIQIPFSKERRKFDKYVEIIGARENNLKNINVKFPVGVLTCVTGVSGSGKSSLVNEVLYKNLMKKIHKSTFRVGECDDIIGFEYFDKIIEVDQSPIGRTPRSNPATYVGLFDLIRDLFAELKMSKMRGYKKGRFSFNISGGRCEACKGDGILCIEMNFLPDVYVPCEVCKGKRYNRETLEVKYKDKSIYDILEMTVEEAYKFFENMPLITKKLETLMRVGLSYVKLGQSSTTLSGGEAQRIKLANYLSKRSTGKTVYILDEPTTGLHFADVHKLVDILQELVDKGNTVIVIEHNLDVIKTADYIIDIGKEGGELGGEILVCGTPEDVMKNKDSYTGKYLKKIIDKK